MQDGQTAQFNESGEGSVYIREVTAKSFAVLGDTRPIKDSLKALGGRFNKRINLDGGEAIGWTFPNSSRETVENFIEAANNGETPSGVPSLSSGDDLPTVPVPRDRAYQTLHQKVFRPVEGMSVTLRDSRNATLSQGTVVRTSSTGNVVDTVWIDFGGKTSMGTICWGRWVIFGYTLPNHSLFFQ